MMHGNRPIVATPRSALHIGVLAKLLLLTLCVASCQGPESTGSLHLAVAVDFANITRVRATSSALDIPTITVDLVRNNNVWIGVIGDIPAGINRTIRIDAYDAGSVLRYTGQVNTVNVTAGQITAVALTLQEASPDPPFQNSTPIIDTLTATPLTVTAGGTVTLTATAHDPNPGDTLRYAWTASAGTFSATNQLNTTWTAPSTLGIVSLTLTVTDAQGLSASVVTEINVIRPGGVGSASLNIRFNRSPVVSLVLAQPGRLDTNQITNLSVTASDPDGDPLSYTWSADCPGQFSTTSGTSPRFTPTTYPATSTCDNCNVTVNVSDNQGATSSGSVALCIINDPVNRFAPIIVRSYQSSLSAQPGQQITFEAAASDPQGSTLSFTWATNLNVSGLGAPQSTSATSSRNTWTAPACTPIGVVPNVSVTVRNIYAESVTRTFTLSGLPLCRTGLSEILVGQIGGVDGTGTAARFFSPIGAVADNLGNLYLADSANHLIRLYNTSTGVVTTVAGGRGTSGYVDGPSTSARFNSPFGLAYDVAAQTLYIADTGNHAIRQYSVSTGQVSTLAGLTGGLPGRQDGTGSSAGFNSPHSLFFDSVGRALYVADTLNQSIRRIDVTTRQVTTFAGSSFGTSGYQDGTGTSAQFWSPTGLTSDGTALYVADQGNHLIRRIALAGAQVTTIAGGVPNGATRTPGSADGTGRSALFNGPWAIAWDGAGSLYIADTANSTLRRLVISTQVVTTVAGAAGTPGNTDATAGAARFNQPRGLVYASGQLFVVDTNNHVLRRYAPATGVVTTLAGRSGSVDGTGNSASFSGPGYLTTDGQGNVYLSETTAVIRRINTSTGAVATIAGSAGLVGAVDATGTAARFRTPRGLAFDGTRNRLYVADRANQTIRQIDLATGNVTTLAGTATIVGSADGIGAAARFNQPEGLTFDGTRTLYVSDWLNRTLRSVDVVTGQVTTVAGTAGQVGTTDGIGPAARFNATWGLTYDGAGNVYMVDGLSHTVRQFNVTTRQVTTLAGNAGLSGSDDGVGTAARFNSPQSLLYLSDDTLLIADSLNHALRRLSLSTRQVETIAGRSDQALVRTGPLDQTRFDRPTGLVGLGGNSVAVSDESANVILVLRGL